MQRGEFVGEGDPEEFFGRVIAAMERIIHNHAGGRVVVACHGGVINGYLAHVLGLENKAGFFHPDYTSIHRVRASSKGVRSIGSINEVAHLRNTGLL
jgi:2,3-bisphosphoglycerate-dependent phosphoglycerate mutase